MLYLSWTCRGKGKVTHVEGRSSEQVKRGGLLLYIYIDGLYIIYIDGLYIIYIDGLYIYIYRWTYI